MSILSILGQAMDYNYTYGENLQNVEASDAAIAAAAVGMMIFIAIGAVIGYVIHAFLLGRIFKKAGVEPWKAWVPVYNAWIMLELGDQKGWWALLALVPFVNLIALVFIIIAEYNITLKLGKEGAFVLLAIFLPIVWMAWLAFDKSTWNGTKPVLATAGTAPSVEETPKTEDTKPPTAPPAA